jgi:hypothetical protein
VKAARAVPVVVAMLVLAACGARVTVGFVDAPDAGGLEGEGGPPPPPPFGGDASRPEATAPSPGCADKLCGAFCTPCEDDASACPPASIFHVCSSMGECLPEQPGCVVIHEIDGAPPPATYVPCAGRACGAVCPSCAPNTPGCPAPVFGVCLADGACGAAPAECR